MMADPYGPYYPGDEYVDWVGLSLYHYPPNEVNTVPTSNQIYDFITGVIPGLPVSLVPTYNFYGRFAQAKNKPMILSESGSPYKDEVPPGDGELVIKRIWWTQLLDGRLARDAPLLKAAVNFEERKKDSLKENFKDWRIVASPNAEVRNAFVADLNRWEGNILFGNTLEFQCDGSLGVRA
jgi:beta-mannanase